MARSRRIRREHATIVAMIRLYCRRRHGRDDEFCEACTELLEYAGQRLDRCPFAADKPTCARCPVHCYHADRREKIREVMRFSGPKMIIRHPLLAIRHFADGRRKTPAPAKPESSGSNSDS